MDIDSVFAELAAAVNDAELTGNNLRVTALKFAPEAIDPPLFEIAEFSIVYHRTMATPQHPQGQAELTITANLLVSRGDDEGGQVEARRLAGTGVNTIITAIEAARGEPGQPALNGAADDCYVRSARGPRLVDYGEVKYYGIEFIIFAMGN